MKQEQELERLITFSSLHIDVVGPGEVGNSPLANRCVTDFLQAVEHDVRNLLRERAEASPSLEGFRLLFG